MSARSFCDVKARGVGQVESEESEEVERQCHEQIDFQEVAWDEVNHCRLDSVNVREAWRAKPQNEHTHRSSDPVMQGSLGASNSNSTDCQHSAGRSEPEAPTQASKDSNRWEDPDIFTATPPTDAFRLIVSIAAIGD